MRVSLSSFRSDVREVGLSFGLADHPSLPIATGVDYWAFLASFFSLLRCIASGEYSVSSM